MSTKRTRRKAPANTKSATESAAVKTSNDTESTTVETPNETSTPSTPTPETPSEEPSRPSRELKDDIKDLLDPVRNSIKMDGGDLTVYDSNVTDNTLKVHLYLTGNCIGCPMATFTIRGGIERYLKTVIKGKKVLDPNSSELTEFKEKYPVLGESLNNIDTVEVINYKVKLENDEYKPTGEELQDKSEDDFWGVDFTRKPDEETSEDLGTE